MFLISAFRSISFFSTFRRISRSETAHLPPESILNVYKFLQRIFCWAKTNQVDNSRLLQTSSVWWQNMSCLRPVRICFFLTCTRLDATDCSWPARLQRKIQETITGHILAPVLFFILKMWIALDFPGICLFVCLFVLTGYIHRATEEWRGSKVTPSPNDHVEFSFRWSGNCLDKLPVTFRAFAFCQSKSRDWKLCVFGTTAFWFVRRSYTLRSYSHSQRRWKCKLLFLYM